METRTQWELAGVTIALALAAGTYNIGKSASDDTVKQLEKSINSYEKSDKLNTEEFIDMAILTTKELKLSADERKQFRQMKTELKMMNSELDKMSAESAQLTNDVKNSEKILEQLNESHLKEIDDLKSHSDNALSNKDKLISDLKIKITKYELPTQSFSLPIGSGINLKKGAIQVGIAKIEHGNICHVSINNEKREMIAGEFASLENCRVTLTECDYYSSSKSASFEMVCKG